MTMFGVDLLGWAVKLSVWNDITKSVGTASSAYAGIGGFPALILTYLFLLVVMGIGAKALGANIKTVRLGFTLCSSRRVRLPAHRQLGLHRGHAGQAGRPSASAGR